MRIEGEIARGADTAAAVSLSAGGQGANVAAWAATLGAQVRWLGKRAAETGRGVSRQTSSGGSESSSPGRST